MSATNAGALSLTTFHFVFAELHNSGDMEITLVPLHYLCRTKFQWALLGLAGHRLATHYVPFFMVILYSRNW